MGAPGARPAWLSEVAVADDNGVSSRLIALTDGVTATAMMLLVLNIQFPGSGQGAVMDWKDLPALREQFFAYVTSFIVVALLWLTHAQKFRNLPRFTGTLFWMNIIFMLCVGLVPFTAGLLASSGNGMATAIYSTAMGVASTMLGLMSVHVSTAGLAREDGSKAPFHPAMLIHFLSAGIFFIAVVVSFRDAQWAKACWLLLIPMAFIPQLPEAGA